MELKCSKGVCEKHQPPAAAHKRGKRGKRSAGAPNAAHQSGQPAASSQPPAAATAGNTTSSTSSTEATRQQHQQHRSNTHRSTPHPPPPPPPHLRQVVPVGGSQRQQVHLRRQWRRRRAAWHTKAAVRGRKGEVGGVHQHVQGGPISTPVHSSSRAAVRTHPAPLHPGCFKHPPKLVAHHLEGRRGWLGGGGVDKVIQFEVSSGGVGGR